MPSAAAPQAGPSNVASKVIEEQHLPLCNGPDLARSDKNNKHNSCTDDKENLNVRQHHHHDSDSDAVNVLANNEHPFKLALTIMEEQKSTREPSTNEMARAPGFPSRCADHQPLGGAHLARPGVVLAGAFQSKRRRANSTPKSAEWPGKSGHVSQRVGPENAKESARVHPEFLETMAVASARDAPDEAAEVDSHDRRQASSVIPCRTPVRPPSGSSLASQQTLVDTFPHDQQHRASTASEPQAASPFQHGSVDQPQTRTTGSASLLLNARIERRSVQMGRTQSDQPSSHSSGMKKARARSMTASSRTRDPASVEDDFAQMIVSLAGSFSFNQSIEGAIPEDEVGRSADRDGTLYRTSSLYPLPSPGRCSPWTLTSRAAC